jgi:plastocyanin
LEEEMVQRRTAQTTPGIEVKIDNFSYSPAAVTVKAGTKVRWTNHDDIPHTVISSDSGFKSKTSIPMRSSHLFPPILAPTVIFVPFIPR